MTNTKQIIITLNAKALFDYFPKKPTENNQCFKLDFSDPVHSYVVTQEITREDCPLFHQIYEVLKKRQGSSFQVTEKTLYDKFLVRKTLILLCFKKYRYLTSSLEVSACETCAFSISRE